MKITLTKNVVDDVRNDSLISLLSRKIETTKENFDSLVVSLPTILEYKELFKTVIREITISLLSSETCLWLVFTTSQDEDKKYYYEHDLGNVKHVKIGSYAYKIQKPAKDVFDELMKDENFMDRIINNESIQSINLLGFSNGCAVACLVGNLLVYQKHIRVKKCLLLGPLNIGDRNFITLTENLLEEIYTVIKKDDLSTFMPLKLHKPGTLVVIDKDKIWWKPHIKVRKPKSTAEASRDFDTTHSFDIYLDELRRKLWYTKTLKPLVSLKDDEVEVDDEVEIIVHNIEI